MTIFILIYFQVCIPLDCRGLHSVTCCRRSHVLHLRRLRFDTASSSALWTSSICSLHSTALSRSVLRTTLSIDSVPLLPVALHLRYSVIAHTMHLCSRNPDSLLVLHSSLRCRIVPSCSLYSTLDFTVSTSSLVWVIGGLMPEWGVE